MKKQINVEITAITKGGEEKVRSKINLDKRHSINNTIIGWNIYHNGEFVQTLMKYEDN